MVENRIGLILWGCRPMCVCVYTDNADIHNEREREKATMTKLNR